MNKTALKGNRLSRIFAMAMALMLICGICCPAASAESVESLSEDPVTDAMVTVDSSLESLGDKLTAIQEAVSEQADSAESAPAEESGTTPAAAPAESPSGTESASEEGSSVPSLSDLLHINVSDVHDNNPEVSVKHDITVDVDLSRFNNNTIIRIRQATPDRSPVTPNYVPASTNPKTGDLNNVTLWIAIVTLSALALAAVCFFLLRRRKKN